MISLDSIKNEFSSLASVPDDEINAVLSEAKRKTILLRSVLKLSIIFISGCLYLLAKAYLMDKGYSRFTSMLGSIFIIAFALIFVNFIDEKILIRYLKKTL